MLLSNLPTAPANRQPPTANWLLWVIAAALSAWACQLAVQHATPIDRALPLIAVAVTLLAAVSYPAVMIGVPLLVLLEVVPVLDEPARLLAIGVVVSVALGVALASSRNRTLGSQLTTVIAIFLLRWIPIANVEPIRELFLIGIALAIVFVLGRTPLAVTIAVVTALITPAVPLRTLALPLLVLFAAMLARLFGMPRVHWTWPSTVVLGFVMLFFAWSGVVARAFPYFLRRAQPSQIFERVGQALPANGTLTLGVPPGARSLIVSGANVARLRRGTPLARIEPLGIVRVGDCSDWGYTRREHFYGTHNPLPRDPAGHIRDYGYAAWLDGAGRLPLPPGTRTVVITADAALPPGALLQVEGFE